MALHELRKSYLTSITINPENCTADLFDSLNPADYTLHVLDASARILKTQRLNAEK